ncbi:MULTISPECIES: carboxypeptidase regulatory-like domain-containing protein [Caballeronia]|uniref:carboxypeptidase regulatory-like domain-containing protein n=1 Tax=Caballeronia TaxID=1827195 RepID=UPI001FCFB126|nr:MULTISPECIES: carboxypeptidase regulatory-like domain-containing protein [Caballeronia]MDR5799223.1 carboxypeptidase regulatory-like domain-containing protein [Caballeronia sp. LZ001]
MLIFLARVFSTSLLFSAIVCANVSAQPLPVPAEHNGIRYVTGGIGEDEVKAFRSVAPRYNVRITLSAKSGHYLSDVDVKISAKTRSLLSVRTAGPFLFVHLPAGQYQISARDRHVTETRKIVVPPRGGIDVHFSWEDPDRHDVMQICTGCRAP